DIGNTIYAAVVAVAVRIAKIVLHVANDWVLPIEEIDGAVRPKLDVRWPKVRVAGIQDRLEFRAREAGALVFDLVAQDALRGKDHIADQQIALEFIGEVPAGQDFDAGARPRALLINLWRASVFLRKRKIAGEQRAVEWDSPGAIHNDVLSPAIEYVPVRISEGE